MPGRPVQANQADAWPTYTRPVPCLRDRTAYVRSCDRQRGLTGAPRQECLASGMADVLPRCLPDLEPHTSDTSNVQESRRRLFHYPPIGVAENNDLSQNYGHLPPLLPMNEFRGFRGGGNC